MGPTGYLCLILEDIYWCNNYLRRDISSSFNCYFKIYSLDNVVRLSCLYL